MSGNKKECVCSGNGSMLFSGHGFSRRSFLRVAGTSVVASWFARFAAPELLYGAAGVRPRLRGTARNCIFIFLAGGPSQSDMFDLKEGPWTPNALQPTSYGDLRWPRGLMPKLSEHLDKLAIVRTARAWAAVHPLAQKWSQISRDPSPAAAAFAPHIGAVVALEKELSRSADDVLPAFIAFGETAAASGYLPGRTGPLSLTADARRLEFDVSGEGVVDLSHPAGIDRLDRRWKMIQTINGPKKADLGKDAADMLSFYDGAKRLADTPSLAGLFRLAQEEQERYGKTALGDSLLLARNMIAANQGTHFVQVTHDGWDHHSEIYEPAPGSKSILSNCSVLDRALGALLSDLSATAGVASGKTLLDETLIVILGEFGRTVGPLTASMGRDHLLRMSVAFAGGGVKGKVIGATAEDGDAVKEYGWSGARDVRPEDLTATIYSALGIDYTTVRTDDPLSDGFEYVPHASKGRYMPVDELFL